MAGEGCRKDKTRTNVSFDKRLVHRDACSAGSLSQHGADYPRLRIEPEPVKIMPSSLLTPSG